MSELLKKLAELADELDKTGSAKIANELDDLIKAIAPLAAEEETFMTICPGCEGEGHTVDSPFCDMCNGEGFVKGASISKRSFIRHRGNYWIVLSRNGKELGKYKTKAEAFKRLQQIEYFKSHT